MLKLLVDSITFFFFCKTTMNIYEPNQHQRYEQIMTFLISNNTTLIINCLSYLNVKA